MSTKFYAVARGRSVGVFRRWGEVLESTQRFSGAMFRGFTSDAEARAFVTNHAARSSVAPLPIASVTTDSGSGSAGGGTTLAHAAGAGSSSSSSSSTPGFSFLLRFDGACVGNPGPGGAGALLYGVPDGGDVASGTGTGWGAASSALDDAAGVARGGWAPLWEAAAYVGSSTTNNVAEYNGLILGLVGALKVGVGRQGARLCVQGDSELIIRQVLGEYEVKAEHLKPLRAEAARLIALLRSRKTVVVVSHVLRHCNAEADRLSNVGLTRIASVFEHPHTDALAKFKCWCPPSPPDVIQIKDDDDDDDDDTLPPPLNDTPQPHASTTSSSAILLAPPPHASTTTAILLAPPPSPASKKRPREDVDKRD
jgi:ribonuclease HI